MALYFICIALSVFFSLFSFTMAIPFLGILFGNQPLVTDPVPFSFKIDAIEHNFNYYISHIITVYGPGRALLVVSLIIIIMVFLKTGFLFLSDFFMSPVRNNVVRDIRNDLFRKILYLPLSYYSGERKGDLISRITGDVQEIDFNIVLPFKNFIKEPVTILIYLGTLIYMSPTLTIFVFLMLPISGGVIGRVGRTLRKKSVLGQKRFGSLISILEESISGLKVIKAFNAENKTRKKFTDENNAYAWIQTKLYRRQNLASPLSEFLGTIVMVFVMWYGATYVLKSNGDLTPQEFMAYLIIFSQIINPAKSLSTSWYNLQKGFASWERIEAIFNADNVILQSENAIRLSNFKSQIEFRNVWFKYQTDNVLKNINLVVPKGKTIALVGQSGSGKSSMVELIPRFYDISQGDIFVDGIKIQDLHIADLRHLIGYVNQDPILFNDTIFNNIAFGVESAAMEEVIEAAKVANAHQFILESPEGYQTSIGDRGGKLSGGQRQRISIARAVLKNPPILILDEATSSLDTESERLVQDALNHLMKNRTTIVIAHRLSTVIHADEICVLHEGEIVERGNHESLLKLNGYYKRLHDLQMFSDE